MDEAIQRGMATREGLTHIELVGQQLLTGPGAHTSQHTHSPTHLLINRQLPELPPIGAIGVMSSSHCKWEVEEGEA